eukprot:4279785-Prymnesium_polylepis.1
MYACGRYSTALRAVPRLWRGPRFFGPPAVPDLQFFLRGAMGESIGGPVHRDEAHISRNVLV